MRFVGQETLKPFATNSLAGVIAPFKFRTPTGALALGYEASILAAPAPRPPGSYHRGEVLAGR